MGNNNDGFIPLKDLKKEAQREKRRKFLRKVGGKLKGGFTKTVDTGKKIVRSERTKKAVQGIKKIAKSKGAKRVFNALKAIGEGNQVPRGKKRPKYGIGSVL